MYQIVGVNCCNNDYHQAIILFVSKIFRKRLQLVISSKIGGNVIDFYC